MESWQDKISLGPSVSTGSGLLIGSHAPLALLALLRARKAREQAWFEQIQTDDKLGKYFEWREGSSRVGQGYRAERSDARRSDCEVYRRPITVYGDGEL
jgi:hypothetical protein